MKDFIVKLLGGIPKNELDIHIQNRIVMKTFKTAFSSEGMILGKITDLNDINKVQGLEKTDYYIEYQKAEISIAGKKYGYVEAISNRIFPDGKAMNKEEFEAYFLERFKAGEIIPKHHESKRKFLSLFDSGKIEVVVLARSGTIYPIPVAESQERKTDSLPLPKE